MRNYIFASIILLLIDGNVFADDTLLDFEEDFYNPKNSIFYSYITDSDNSRVHELGLTLSLNEQFVINFFASQYSVDGPLFKLDSNTYSAGLAYQPDESMSFNLTYEYTGKAEKF